MIDFPTFDFTIKKSRAILLFCYIHRLSCDFPTFSTFRLFRLLETARLLSDFRATFDFRLSIICAPTCPRATPARDPPPPGRPAHDPRRRACVPRSRPCAVLARVFGLSLRFLVVVVLGYRRAIKCACGAFFGHCSACRVCKDQKNSPATIAGLFLIRSQRRNGRFSFFSILRCKRFSR